MKKILNYLNFWFNGIFKGHQTISFTLQQWTNGVNPIEDLSITGTGTFKIYRGSSSTPVHTFTLNNNTLEFQLSGADDPNVVIMGSVHRITVLDLHSIFWRPYVGGVQSINLKHALGLKKLALQWNSLDTLDLKECIKLESLDLTNSQKLTTIDLSHNKVLKDITFSQDLMYFVPNVLQSLVLDNPQLMKLVLANQQVLTSLDISKCSNLLMLNILGTQLPGIDITNNTKLNQILCSFNQSIVDNFYQALLSNVLASPRPGILYTQPCPSVSAEPMREELTQTYGWTITCN